MPDHDLTLVYVPHLDYDLQRFGPDDPRALDAARVLDAELAPLLDDAERLGITTVVLSEYGITPADTPVDINRMLRREGLLEVTTNRSGELLDPWTSRAFAVADHQIAHVYVQHPEDIERVRTLLEALPGVDEVLDELAECGTDSITKEAASSWQSPSPARGFTYYYWLDDAKAPDFAKGVEIHKKPGYDPAELFFDPEDKLVKLRAARNLAKKAVGCATPWMCRAARSSTGARVARQTSRRSIGWARAAVL